MIISFSGKAQSGKTTAAKIIKSKIKRAEIVSFADAIRHKVLDDFPFLTMEDLRERKHEKIDTGSRKLTIRQLLIEVGGFYRTIDKSYWLKRLWNKIDGFLKKNYIVLIDDMRYLNEADFMSSHGARLVRIERPGIPLIDDPSETDLDNYLFKESLGNLGTLKEYEMIVDDWRSSEGIGFKINAG
jgi:hypothetical protein